MKKTVDGKEVEMSPSEEAQMRAEWEANAARQPAPDLRKARLMAVGFTSDQADAILSV